MIFFFFIFFLLFFYFFYYYYFFFVAVIYVSTYLCIFVFFVHFDCSSFMYGLYTEMNKFKCVVYFY
jgi:hypothetical protein